MGTPQGALDFFADLNYLCPEHHNPADFFIRTTAVAIGDEVESHGRIQAICNHFALSPLAKEIEESLGLEFKKSELMGFSIADYEAYFGLNHQYVRHLTIKHKITTCNLDKNFYTSGFS